MQRICRRAVAILSTIGAVCLLALATLAAADDRAMILPTDPAPLKVETAAGERSFTIEVADDPGERERGLMFRETMDDAHGMLFVFQEQRPVGFWMKNTPMPLDLLFIDQAGVVKGILPGHPYSEAAITPGVPVKFVLELKAGTAAREHIADGDTVAHPAMSMLRQ